MTITLPQQDLIDSKIAKTGLYGSNKELVTDNPSVKAMLNNQTQINSSIMIAMDIIE